MSNIWDLRLLFQSYVLMDLFRNAVLQNLWTDCQWSWNVWLRINISYYAAECIVKKSFGLFCCLLFRFFESMILLLRRISAIRFQFTVMAHISLERVYVRTYCSASNCYCVLIRFALLSESRFSAKIGNKLIAAKNSYLHLSPNKPRRTARLLRRQRPVLS